MSQFIAAAAGLASAFRPLAAALALAAAAALAAATGARADDAAERHVQGILDEAAPALDAPSREAMLDGIAALVDKHVDLRRVGRFTLGQYARQMTEAQAEVFYPLFTEYATLVYQQTLADYSGQRLEVTGSIDRSARDIIVNSKIVDARPGDQFADLVVHWRVYRSRDGDMTVVDAGANNVWLAIEQRSQFTSVIANNGGGAKGVDALIEQLKTQVEGAS